MVCVGVIAGAHGVKGLVRIKSFTEQPEDVAAYGAVQDEAGGRSFELKIQGKAKGTMLARVTGIDDREAAQALRGTRLFVRRDALPATDDAEEYYHSDLIGLRAELPDGSAFGRVRGVNDFGAGDLLEITRPGKAAVVLPFTREAVPVVDLPGGRLVVDPPAGLLPEAAAEDEPGQGGRS